MLRVLYSYDRPRQLFDKSMSALLSSTMYKFMDRAQLELPSMQKRGNHERQIARLHGIESKVVHVGRIMMRFFCRVPKCYVVWIVYM